MREDFTKKNSYEVPQLKVYGNIHELTHDVNKIVNSPSDGFSFCGQPLQQGSNCNC